MGEWIPTIVPQRLGDLSRRPSVDDVKYGVDVLGAVSHWNIGAEEAAEGVVPVQYQYQYQYQYQCQCQYQYQYQYQ
ncbi:hypothetical protein AK812_SmicGene12179 [Symbiodinium microadriaticum]|uniref:Uncharacterized protein n=1 Tax=Symbiodinium microadriaticum TaxID=2951 RepID=A0A1Q9EBD9_SYMMI|nr:hypothetical protein AK812_SmicGene12179 [Symbiodinium microadriaticum]